MPSSDYCRTETVLPPSDHYYMETLAPSGYHCFTDTEAPSSDHYCIDIVVTSSEHYCSKKIAPPIDTKRTLITVTNRLHFLPSRWCRLFHHDSQSSAFSVSGHLWPRVDAIDAHATFQPVKPSHLWTSSGSGSRHLRRPT